MRLLDYSAFWWKKVGEMWASMDFSVFEATGSPKNIVDDKKFHDKHPFVPGFCQKCLIK